MGRGGDQASALLFGPARRRSFASAPVKSEPEMVAVESSNVARVGFLEYYEDPETGELYADFKNGTTYVWSDVGRELYDELLGAPSKGSFLNRHIVGQYPSRKL